MRGFLHPSSSLLKMNKKEMLSFLIHVNKNLENDFEEKEFTLKVKDQEENSIEEIKVQIKEESEEEVKIMKNCVLKKSNLFNLKSLCPEEDESNYDYKSPIDLDSITKRRRQHKRQYIEQNPHKNLEKVSKTLEFGSPEEELKSSVEKLPCPNAFHSIVEKDIDAIEEVSNETFTTLNDQKELLKNNDSLFDLAHTSIHKSEGESASESGEEFANSF